MAGRRGICSAYLPFEKMQYLIESLAMFRTLKSWKRCLNQTKANFEALVVPYTLVARDTFAIDK
jgi:hypothetical protein